MRRHAPTDRVPRAPGWSKGTGLVLQLLLSTCSWAGEREDCHGSAAGGAALHACASASNSGSPLSASNTVSSRIQPRTFAASCAAARRRASSASAGLRHSA